MKKIKKNIDNIFDNIIDEDMNLPQSALNLIADLPPKKTIGEKKIMETTKTQKAPRSKFLRFAAVSMACVLMIGASIGGYFLFRGGNNGNLTIAQYARALDATAAALKAKAQASSLSVASTSVNDSWDSNGNDWETINYLEPVKTATMVSKVCALILKSDKITLPDNMQLPIRIAFNLDEDDYLDMDLKGILELTSNNENLIGTFAFFNDDLNHYQVVNFTIVYDYKTETFKECGWSAMFSSQDYSAFAVIHYKAGGDVKQLKAGSEKYNNWKARDIANFAILKSAEKIPFAVSMTPEFKAAEEYVYGPITSTKGDWELITGAENMAIGIGTFLVKFCESVFDSDKLTYTDGIIEFNLNDVPQELQEAFGLDNQNKGIIEFNTVFGSMGGKEVKKLSGTFMYYNESETEATNYNVISFSIVYDVETGTIIECKWSWLSAGEDLNFSAYEYLQSKGDAIHSLKSNTAKYHEMKEGAYLKLKELRNAEKLSFDVDMTPELEAAFLYALSVIG